MSKEKVVCQICGREVKYSGLSIHLHRSHIEINKQDYYDKYIDSSDHICKCGKPLSFIRITDGYTKTCGDSKCCWENIKEAVLKKYNVENVWQLDSVKEKIKETNLKNTGYECSLKNPECRQKGKETKKERYGDENYNNREKSAQTCFKNSGYECSWKDPKVIQKSKNTKLERYDDAGYHNFEQMKETNLKNTGYKYSFENIEVRQKGNETKFEKYGDKNYNNPEKAKETYFERTGYGHQWKNPECRQKGKQTNLERYGDENYNGDTSWGGIGIKSQKLFVELDKRIQEQNIKYSRMNYGLIENEKKIKKEKIIYVKDVSKTHKVRFLDCYIEINNRQICFEFDEKWHDKTIEKDIIREQEILTIKPNLEIYRIKERYFDENMDQVLNDLISIVKDKLSITYFNYNNLLV
jgi:hypothetical protein